MSRLLTASLLVAMLLVARGPAVAHHSMAVYDVFTVPIEGTVQQFRFVNPHSVIVLKVKTPKGGTVIWHLEGDRPGWCATAIRAICFARATGCDCWCTGCETGNRPGFGPQEWSS